MDLKRAHYSDSIPSFLACDEKSVLGALTAASEFSVDVLQRNAWQEEIRLLRNVLPAVGPGEVFLEFVVPRLGKRIDAVLLLRGVVFVLEFKTGAAAFLRADVEQVWDYALDLKNFHETSHHRTMRPVLVITAAHGRLSCGDVQAADHVADPSLVSADRLGEFLLQVLEMHAGEGADDSGWQSGRYRPTPTIKEAATRLYRRHSVKEIARHDAGAKNLARTSEKVASIISHSRDVSCKSICFVTGVPGAGKTLVGLDVATRFQDAGSQPA